MTQTAQLSAQNPWPGLRAFAEGDRDFFFGRERETSELVDLVQRSSVVVLYGQSGLGKTSLLQAGLLPELKGLDFLPLRVRFDHGDDAPPLAQQVEAEITALLDSTNSSTPRPAPNETLWEYFHRRDVDFWGPRNRLLVPVIVLDQFEEVFTLGQRSEKSVARVADFAAELEAVLEHRAPEAVRKRLDANPDAALHYDLDRRHVKFVVSLREDFLPDLDPWRMRMPSLLANRFRLERMTGAQALDVVERGGRDLLDSGVAREIVDFVSKSKRESAARAMEQRDVEPALLSVVCDELNRRRIERGKSRITVDLLTDEREEIILNFYERAFDGLDPRVRDWVEDKLLTGSGYRNRAALEDALKAGLPESAFDQLVDGRILHREERAGVVWLELTHDLLSDPASQSRALREQRRQAEVSKQREAELSAQLANSRRQVAVYGTLLVVIVLLIGAGTAVYLLTALNRRSKLQAEKLGASNSEMVKQLSSQSTEIGGAWVPTQTLLQMIGDRNDFFQKGLPPTSSPDALLNFNQTHVIFLTQASEALYDVGRYEEGLKDAQEALAALDQQSWPASSRDAVRHMRAEALHNQAAGLLAVGKLSGARKSYTDALALLHGTTPKNLDSSSAHVYVLSNFGLGEVELQCVNPGDAVPYFQAALDFANATTPETESVHWWKALAYQGLALSQWDDREAGKWYAKADNEVQALIQQDPNNPRWKRLFADIAYRQGYAANDLSQYDAATQLFEQSQGAAQELVTRDPNNRDWQLALLQAQRGLGLDRDYLGEWKSSQEILEQADKTAASLSSEQPTWARAAFLHALIVETLGYIQQYSHSSDPAPEQAAAIDSASKLFDEAHDILQRSANASPEDMEVLRLIPMTIKDQGDLLAGAARRLRNSAGDDKQKLAKADQKESASLNFYLRAIDAWRPLETASKRSIVFTGDKADIQSALGDVYRDLKQPKKAVPAYMDSAEGYEAIAKAQVSPEHFDKVFVIHLALGNAYEDEPDFAKASAEFKLAQDAITKALKIQPTSAAYLGDAAFIHYRFADLALKGGDAKGALDQIDKAISTQWQALQNNYADSQLNTNLDAYRTMLDTIEKKIEPDSGKSAPSGIAGAADSNQQVSVASGQNKALLSRIDALRENSDPILLLSHYGQSSAALRPILPGVWRILTGPEFTAARDQLLALVKNMNAKQVQGVRKLPLDFYRGADLYEALVKTSNGKDGIADFVLLNGQRFLLDGSYDPIDKLNKLSPPVLDTPDRATAYLRFWLEGTQREDKGRLLIVDGVDDLNWLPSTPMDRREATAGKATPLVLDAGSGGAWNAIGSVELGGELDRASFNISRSGAVSVPRSELIARNLPISVDVFGGGIRVQETTEDMWKASVKGNPDDEFALKQLIFLYTDQKRWADGAQADQNWIAHLQRHSKDDKDYNDDMVQAYTVLDADQLLSHDLNGALATAKTLKAFAPNNLQGDRMTAHSLLLLGHTQEAEAIYLSNYDKPLGSTTWQAQIIADIKDFPSEGLDNPDLLHILDLFALEPINRLKAHPDDPQSVQKLPEAYFQAKHYSDAVDAEKKWIDFVNRNQTDSPKRTQTLASAYLALSWYQLFARDYAGALASSEQGKKIVPSDLFLDTNRAHALLFLGRIQEAEAIYLGNRGKKFSADGKEIWEDAILDDFDTFQKAGITNPEMDKIRKLLSSPQDR